MNPILVIAGKEVSDGLRNRWVAGATLLLAALAFSLTFLGSAPTGELGAKPLAVTVVSLSSLTIFLMPLIGLLISYDAIVGEVERGSMLLLLAYPVTRSQIILGKFAGHAAILAVATVLGYGAAGAAAAVTGQGDPQSWRAFALLIVTSVLLGAAFVALAYCVSASVKERSTAAGLAVGLWLLFVVIYDLAVMGLLLSAGGAIGAEAFTILLLANPSDVYRLINLTTFENVRSFAGMAGLSEQAHLPAWLLFTVQLLWIVGPLAVARLRFGRVE